MLIGSYSHLVSAKEKLDIVTLFQEDSRLGYNKKEFYQASFPRNRGYSIIRCKRGNCIVQEIKENSHCQRLYDVNKLMETLSELDHLFDFWNSVILTWISIENGEIKISTLYLRCRSSDGNHL